MRYYARNFLRNPLRIQLADEMLRSCSWGTPRPIFTIAVQPHEVRCAPSFHLVKNSNPFPETARITALITEYSRSTYSMPPKPTCITVIIIYKESVSSHLCFQRALNSCLHSPTGLKPKPTPTVEFSVLPTFACNSVYNVLQPL